MIKMQEEQYKDEKYESLLEAIENKDDEAADRFEKATKEGKTIRII